MQLEHSFSVPVGVDEAWRLLLDIERIAPCIPGASIQSVDGHEITGAIKVRIGTIGPTYKGTASVSEMDPEGRRAIINAHGESRSNGSATAKVIATLSEFGGATSVMLMTEIDFTGKPAQLERTVISDAGARLVRQFAERLAAMLAEQTGAEQTSPEPADTEPKSAAEQREPEQPDPGQPDPDKATTEQSLAAPVSQDPPVSDDVGATPVRRPRPRPSAGSPEDTKSGSSKVSPPKPSAAADSTPAPASTPGESSDRVVPRIANSARPPVEVIPTEPSTGLEMLLKRLAPFAILVIILLLRQRRRRRRR